MPLRVSASDGKFRNGWKSKFFAENRFLCPKNAPMCNDPANSALTKLLNTMIARKVPDEVAPTSCGAQLHVANWSKLL